MALTEVNSLGIKDLEVKTADIAADAVTGAKIADDAVDSEHYVDGSVDHAHLAADCVDGDNIQDDVINSEHIAAGAIDLEHMSSESVDEDNLHISNAGSNGQFLSKQSGNSGGLTWASVSSTPEGDTILSTTNSNEANTKFLRADGDGTCSWQVPPAASSVSGNFTITGGNLVIGTDNWGIDFSADTNNGPGTINSEILDDYEEGSWTPVISGNGYTYTAGNYVGGQYTKIGRMVQIEGHINVSGLSGSADGSITRITLPFSPQAIAGGANWNRAICSAVYFNSSAIAKIYCVQLSVNSTSLDVCYTDNGANSTQNTIDFGNDWQSGSTNSQIGFGLSYRTAT